MILPEADLAAAIPRRQFASLDAALKYFHHRLLAGARREFRDVRQRAEMPQLVGVHHGPDAEHDAIGDVDSHHAPRKP